MKVAISIPRLPDGPGLRAFVQRAEALGFDAVLAGDHIVLPTGGTKQYPYTSDGSFSRPADEPFLETMTLLGYLAACSESKDVRLTGRFDRRQDDLRRGCWLAGEGV